MSAGFSTYTRETLPTAPVGEVIVYDDGDDLYRFNVCIFDGKQAVAVPGVGWLSWSDEAMAHRDAEQVRAERAKTLGRDPAAVMK